MKCHAASRHHYRPLRHVVGTERDDVGRRTLVLSHQQELVLLGRLLGYGLGRVVQFVEHILVGHAAQACTLQLVAQIVAERLGRREEHTAIADSIAADVVKLAVGVGFHVVVQTVHAQQFQQCFSLHLLFRQIGQVDTRRVALILHVEFELFLFDARRQQVDILHHQVPVALRRTVRGVLQRLDEKHLVDRSQVGGKLTHLIGNAAVCIFEGYGQHLVGLQA